MSPGQTSLPRQWFVIDGMQAEAYEILRRLPRGTGVLVLDGKVSADLRRLARSRCLTIAHERDGGAIRVHNVRELRRALLLRTPLILLSPIYPTASHPEWTHLPLMRAAALARLAGRRLIALGGLDSKRFRRVERLGFQGWAGISAFRI